MPSFLFVGKESCLLQNRSTMFSSRRRVPFGNSFKAAKFFKDFSGTFFFSMVKKHARLAVRLKRHYKNNFCSFYPLKLKVCRMVELCIRN